MSIDSDTFNFLKNGYKTLTEQATAKTGLDPLTILKIIGGILGSVVIVVWLSIIINKHRERRAALSKQPITRARNARPQRNRY